MRQLQVPFRFALQLIERRVVEHDQFREELQRDIALEMFVKGAPDDSHSPAAENAFQGVTPKEFLARCKTAQGLAEIEFDVVHGRGPANRGQCGSEGLTSCRPSV